MPTIAPASEYDPTGAREHDPPEAGPKVPAAQLLVAVTYKFLICAFAIAPPQLSAAYTNTFGQKTLVGIATC